MKHISHIHASFMNVRCCCQWWKSDFGWGKEVVNTSVTRFTSSHLPLRYSLPILLSVAAARRSHHSFPQYSVIYTSSVCLLTMNALRLASRLTPRATSIARSQISTSKFSSNERIEVKQDTNVMECRPALVPCQFAVGCSTVC